MWPFRSRRGQADTSKTSPTTTAVRGARGEKLARKHLRKKGMKILATNYRCPAGEADIIALDRRTKPDTLVFVEVKTRRRDKYTSPAGAVNADKRRRVQKVAGYYLRQKQADDLHVRYDIVSIVLPDEGEPLIEHISDAFD
ncbi:MAG: YraN family protein [Phycisphaerae bacterium]|nr:YraN family protein [Phycisphaerae bacterium]